MQRRNGATARRATHVAIPENMRMPTSVQVEVMPSADEKDRNRNGTKDVGMILHNTSDQPDSRAWRPHCIVQSGMMSRSHKTAHSHGETDDLPLIAREDWPNRLERVREEHDECDAEILADYTGHSEAQTARTDEVCDDTDTTPHSHPSSHFEDEQPRDPLLPRRTETIPNHIGEAPESPILLDDSEQQLEPGAAELDSDGDSNGDIEVIAKGQTPAPVPAHTTHVNSVTAPVMTSITGPRTQPA